MADAGGGSAQPGQPEPAPSAPSQPPAMAVRRLDITDHCLERPERLVSGDAKATCARIEEVVRCGWQQPTWSSSQVPRFTHFHRGDAVATNLEGTVAITWLPGYTIAKLPEWRIRGPWSPPACERCDPLDASRWTLRCARAGYDAVEHDGRGRVCFGYLRVYEGEELLSFGGPVAGGYTDQFSAYVYAFSATGQGWVAAHVLTPGEVVFCI